MIYHGQTCETCNAKVYDWGQEDAPQGGTCRYCDVGICARCAAKAPEVCCEECRVLGVCASCDLGMRTAKKHAQEYEGWAANAGASVLLWLDRASLWAAAGRPERSDLVTDWAACTARTAAHWGRLVLAVREYRV